MGTGAFSCRIPPVAKETDPERWWVLEEVGCHLQTDDPPCHFCIVQGTVIRDKAGTGNCEM
jgi:hypothetical protein